MKVLRKTTAAVFCIACLASNIFASYIVAPAKTDPQRLRWRERTIRIALSSSLIETNSNIKLESDVKGAVLRSLRLWENAADLQFVIEPSDRQSVSPTGAAGDGVSLITIAASPENVLLFSRNPFSESARTRVFYNRNGNITEADIVLNPYQQFSTDGTFGTFDLEATLAHEIGHLLGLRHSGVLGAVMSAGVSRNGTVGVFEERSVNLADSDIAAVRELYGFDDQVEACCGTVSGKLTPNSTRSAGNLKVWAEDNKTGRVAAQTETSADGTFRIGGLPDGAYSVFWQRSAGVETSPIGELGTVRIAKDETRILNEKIDLQRSDLSLRYVGMNNQLSESAITVGPGGEYVVYLGGKDLDVSKLSVEFNSPFFRALPGSIKEYDFGEGLSAITFVLSVDPDVPAGVYSIFLTDKEGIPGALIGGLKVRRPVSQ